MHINKGRLNIFRGNSENNKKLLKFDQIGMSGQKYNQCQCLQTLRTCKKLIEIMNIHQLNRAKQHYQYYQKQRLIVSRNNKINNLIKSEIPEIQEVLYPLLINLLQIISPSSIRCLYSILKHAKNQYLTFWIYGLFCSKYPKFKQYSQNVYKIAKINQCQFNIDENLLKVIYNNKLCGIISKHYIIFLKVFLQEKQFIQRITVAGLMEGRDRTQDQVIKTALQLKYSIK